MVLSTPALATQTGIMSTTAGTVANTVAAVTANATQPAPVARFVPGETVIGQEANVRVYADASPDSLLMDSYGKGATFTVLEPSGDYNNYPVEKDGHTWIRARASDGLVGWVMTDTIVPLR